MMTQVIAEKEREIQNLKAPDRLRTGRSRRDRHPSEGPEVELDHLQKLVDQLSRAASAKDQTIVDMREQNLQLQNQIRQLQHQNNSEAEDNGHRRRGSRKSKIPTSQRLPLRVADCNADVSVGVLADGGVAIDLDETVGTSRRNTRRHHESSHRKPSESAEEQKPTRSRRKRSTSLMEMTITEVEERPSQSRRLRSRQY